MDPIPLEYQLVGNHSHWEEVVFIVWKHVHYIQHWIWTYFVLKKNLDKNEMLHLITKLTKYNIGNNLMCFIYCFHTKVVVSILSSNLFMCLIRISICIFYLAYSCMYLELFSDGAIDETRDNLLTYKVVYDN